MREIELLVERYLTAERELVAAVDAAGGAVPLPDGRAVSVGRAEFDALLGGRRWRAWVTIRKNASLPAAALRVGPAKHNQARNTAGAEIRTYRNEARDDESGAH